MNNHKQNILVYINFCEQDNVAIEYGIEIAKAFRKDITLMAVADEDATEQSISDIKQKLDDLISSYQPYHVTRFHEFIEKGHKMSAIQRVSDKIEAASIVMTMEKNSRLRFYRDVQFLKETKNLKVPFLMIQGEKPNPGQSKIIYLPIGFRKEEKEKLVWAGYFGRFNNSKIIIIKAKESDSTAQARIMAHIVFAKKLFDQFNLSYEIIESKKNSFSITREAINMTKEDSKGIVIICTTKHYGPEEEIIGPPELKHIKNREQVPVLCVNPRKDLYVLCE